MPPSSHTLEAQSNWHRAVATSVLLPQGPPAGKIARRRTAVLRPPPPPVAAAAACRRLLRPGYSSSPLSSTAPIFMRWFASHDARLILPSSTWPGTCKRQRNDGASASANVATVLLHVHRGRAAGQRRGAQAGHGPGRGGLGGRMCCESEALSAPPREGAAAAAAAAATRRGRRLTTKSSTSMFCLMMARRSACRPRAQPVRESAKVRQRARDRDEGEAALRRR